ncbi:hypothetical protein [Roseateles oligotrophus]|uniref:Uncharacterized protein n=1 Tax=Roseateles oligotrophus TaxID=1769250 RepID=A0ABT2YM43_9BURK|nr:hypothetical protein [Roseateles oligotrophus]MCV2370960.1 hypothetical protein [Roseateles oligotrophus]
MDALQASKFEGRAAYVVALQQALTQACAAESRDLYCFDESLADWPWSDADVLAALTAWAKPYRRLHLLAAQYEDLRQHHPRFVRWRGNWGHCMQAWAYTPEALAAAGTSGGAQSIFVARAAERNLSVSLFDKKIWRGEISLDAGDAQQKSQWFDALAQRSSESFAVTTLGL